MKKTNLIIPLLALSVLFVGCSDKDGGTASTAAENAEPISEVLSITDDEVKNVLESCSNFTVSEGIYISIPKTEAVYEYTSRITGNTDMESYSEQFNALFEYLFPEHTLDENYLLYTGGSSDIEYDDDGNLIQDYNKVQDFYDEIISGDEGLVAYIYDETWYEDVTEWDSQVCLELGNPIGYGYAVINKGKTVWLTDCKVDDDDSGNERYVCLDSYDPADWLTCVGSYSPESTESFALSSGQMPINEAVSFFEEYINSLPYPKKSELETCVTEVDVLKVTDDIYGYYFLTAPEYKGVPFDYLRSGTQTSDFSDYTAVGGNAFMIESGDIDVVYGYYRSQETQSEKKYTDIIPLETAAKAISGELSGDVRFEVQKVELVYTEKPNKTEEGYIDTENYSAEISPAWKLTLSNTNDTLIYNCYVDACDGDNFRYYTVYTDSTEDTE